jgi:prolyl 4-hydroxylase
MILSIAPRIILIENALTPEECSAIINSDLEFAPSEIDYFGDSVVNANIRSSYTSTDVHENFGYLKNMAIELAEKNSPSKNLKLISEPISFQRYETNQEFSQHCDFGKNGRRHVTVIFYLNDDFEGGETFFELLSLSVKPVTGSCLIFYYESDIDALTKLTRHGGNTVTNGTKYIATVWMKKHDPS